MTLTLAPPPTSLPPPAAAWCPPPALRLACELQVARAELAHRVHPGWLQRLSTSLRLDCAALAASRPGLLNGLLCAQHRLRGLDLSAACSPVELLGLLPSAEVVRLCSARSVYSLRAAMRRCVDAPLRRIIRQAVGTQVFELLMSLPVQMTDPLSLPAGLDAERLCTSGWGRLAAATDWHDPCLQQLACLMLPPATDTPRGDAATRFSAEHTTFLALLPGLFPEHAWLFGYDLTSN